MRKRIQLSLILLASLISACDKNSDSASTASPPPAVPPLPSAIAPRPTTEQFMNTPWVVMNLKYDPISLKVPTGWQIKSHGEMNPTLEGPTPNADGLAISISVQRDITAAQEKDLEAKAKAEAAKHPDLINEDTARDITGARVIESLVVDEPTTSTSDPKLVIQPAQWIFVVCVPGEKGHFKAYDLRFMGLTLKDYTADRDLLRKMMDSLAYVPESEPTVK